MTKVVHRGKYGPVTIRDRETLNGWMESDPKRVCPKSPEKVCIERARYGESCAAFVRKLNPCKVPDANVDAEAFSAWCEHLMASWNNGDRPDMAAALWVLKYPEMAA